VHVDHFDSPAAAYKDGKLRLDGFVDRLQNSEGFVFPFPATPYGVRATLFARLCLYILSIVSISKLDQWSTSHCNKLQLVPFTIVMSDISLKGIVVFASG
jgi:hypothetical protein